MIRAISILILILAAALPVTVYAETVQVVVKKSALRSECRFFSEVLAMVKHNDSLELLSREGDWIWVSYNDHRGCIHNSTVTQREYSITDIFAPGAGETSTEEVALAGKGFSRKVEGEFRKKHPKLNFNDVDKVEEQTVADDLLHNFIKEGKLKKDK